MVKTVYKNYLKSLLTRLFILFLSMISIAFIGTGLMGLPMVQNLSKGNYQINANGWNNLHKGDNWGTATAQPNKWVS